MEEKKWYVYIIKCRNGKVYTGITTNLKRRFSEHTGGRLSSKMVRASGGAVDMLYCQITNSRSEASIREYQIKTLSRLDKLKLIESPLNKKKELYDKT